MKSLISFFTLFFLTASLLVPKKSEAAIVLVAAGTVSAISGTVDLVAGRIGQGSAKLTGGIVASAIAVPTFYAGVFVALFMPPAGIALIILSDDGSLPQTDIESALAQKYPFIQDNKVITDLASLVKAKAGSTKAIDGKKMISLSETEVKSVLESTDLLETHSQEIQKMIIELK